MTRLDPPTGPRLRVGSKDFVGHRVSFERNSPTGKGYAFVVPRPWGGIAYVEGDKP